MALKVGDKAPNFTLIATDKSEVSLSDFKGQKVVLLFFPMAFSGVCTTELCSLRDDIGTYEAMDAQVIAVSVNSFFTLAKFKELEGFSFPLLSDYNKEVCKLYGSFYEEFVLGMKGVSKRSAFVIDQAGIIKYTEVLDSAANIPNFEEVRGALALLY